MRTYVCVTWTLPCILLCACLDGTSSKHASTGRVESAVTRGELDATPTWPLCGRISEAPPDGWQATDGCPPERWGNYEYTDYPLNSPYGPRRLASEDYRYDFHRGIDIQTPVGTPVFAAARGVVRTAGNSGGYSTPAVQLRHYRPDTWGDCTQGGCYHSIYLHLDGWTVEVGDVVEKGALIGYTGVSDNGFAHLHFELRDAPATDPYSSWLRDSIHPLNWLHYPEAALDIELGTIDISNPEKPIVTVDLAQLPIAGALALTRIEVEVYDGYTLVAQPGATPDENGYYVNPPWYDLEQTNFQYTHKDSSKHPWKSFKDCPYSYQHGKSYSAHVHMCQHLKHDAAVGDFNGVLIYPSPFNTKSDQWQLAVTFRSLVGVPAERQAEMCIVARAITAMGVIADEARWGCK